MLKSNHHHQHPVFLQAWHQGGQPTKLGSMLHKNGTAEVRFINVIIIIVIILCSYTIKIKKCGNISSL